MNSICIRVGRFLMMIIAGLIGVQGIVCGDIITFGDPDGSKWGDPERGMPSDTITWTFMAQGTLLERINPQTPLEPLLSQITGGSDIAGMRMAFDNANNGVGLFDQAIQNAFNTWSLASPGRINFQFVPTDTGAPVGNSSNSDSYAVDIRIGAFTPVANSDFAGIAGVGFGPPGNDLNPNFHDALAGDILLNINAPFIVAPGNEGDTFFGPNDAFQNDLENLVLHELGHAAIGLGHFTNDIPMGFIALGDVMYVDNLPFCCNFVNRQLSAHDIEGAQIVYGVNAIPEPSSAIGFALLTVVGSLVRRKYTRA